MQADDSALGAPIERIAVLERDLAPRLLDRTKADRLDLSYIEASRRWSAAVWAAAEALGPVEPTAEAAEMGLALARRPVFICGAHRSGTTLLRDLLDGHPALAVLPFETSFYTHFRSHLGSGAPEVQLSSVGQEWLRRLVNPNNQAPFWLLGRSDGLHSPYVDLARAFRGWHVALKHRVGSMPASLLTAFSLAYAGRAPGSARLWVEKTPTNEQSLDAILADFPEARILHVIRRPDEAYSSLKALQGSRRPIRKAARELRNLARSYAVALERSRSLSGTYRLVRYEELAGDPGAVMDGVAEFLGIEPLAVLTQPTVAGTPAGRNTSFPNGRRGSAYGLSRLELGLLALALGRNAARLGYDCNPFRRR